MAGLAGIYLKRKIDINVEQLIFQMTKSIAYENWYSIDNITEERGAYGRASLGILNPGPQPIFNDNKTIWIIMEGEIFNYDKLKIDLVKKGYNFKLNNDPEFILHLYEEYTDVFKYKLKELNGIFSIIIYDRRYNNLTMCNDRYGFRPVYICDRGDYFLFSSEIKAILQDKNFKKYIDLEAMADFFSFGYILGNKTFFKGIKLLPPASFVKFRNDRISIYNYWNWDNIKSLSNNDEDEIVNELGRLWLQSVERNMKGKSKKGVFLSGGLDSRAIVSAIAQKHYPIHTVTFGKKDCDDYKIAGKVCKALGIKNHFVEISADTWFSDLKKTVYIAEGNLNVIHQHSWDSVDIAKKYFDISLNGLGGDSVAGGSYLMKDFFYITESEKYYNKIFSKMNNEGIPIGEEAKFYSFKILNDLSGLSRESLKREINRQKSSDYLFLNNRIRKFILYGLLPDLTKIENRMPFFDNDFIDFVYGLPNELRFNHYIFNKMLLKFFPKTCLSIPWQGTGLTIGTGKLIKKMYRYYRGGKYKINELIKWAGLPAPFNDNRDYVDYDNWMRVNRELYNYISDVLLKGRILDRGYFNQDSIKNIIDRHMQRKENNSQIIGLLLTFELFNRMFIDDEK